MSLKQEIETWVEALAHYDNNEYDEALKVFDNIADTSKILFNCGVIQATLGEHEKAVECYQRAVALDQYLAVAYFQQGVSNFLLGDFEEALANFNDTLLYLRGNTSIDYEQLGLKFKLFSCEVLFNRGLCYIYLQQEAPGLQDLEYAAKEKVTPDHNVIDEAIREKAEGYTVFSIPVGVVYRPNDAKVKNLKTKDYLGKAKLVAAADRNNAFTGFQGSELKRAQTMEAQATDDRPAEAISYAATNLVQRNLTSRARQLSEPPLNRNTFPPTPPPDSDKSGDGFGGGALTQRAASVRSGRPPNLNFNRAGATTNGRTGEMPSMDRQRPAPSRTASESRRPRQYADSRRDVGRQPAYRETMGSRYPEDGYADDVYDMYTSPRSTGNSSRRGQSRRQQPRYIDEDEEYASDGYEDDTFDDGEFEMMPAPQPRPSQRRRANSRRPDVRKFRVKVHAEGDIRYIMIPGSIDYGEFEGRIREKFGFRSRLRIKMKDEGDMITMADQDDLDLLISNAKDMARREGNDMGKMEIWVEQK
ncbi:hypothetical protein DTO271G3_2783 [Paecilomyces variotii]|nr:hypothetical protein DTO271G3_2783 [Paecilomyces variotii]